MTRLRTLAVFTAAILLAACSKDIPNSAVRLPSVEFVKSQQCRACHVQIYAHYEQTGMGRSFSEVEKLTSQGFIAATRFVHAASGREYEVLIRDGKVIQRRSESGRKNSFELEATHVVGSGNHARTFLHRSAAGEWVELPLTWYTAEKKWAMSPGFDTARPPDFTRIVDDRCLFCHNGYPTADGPIAEGIDCQRCHGPGGQHIQLASSGKSAKAEIVAAIVNPGRLDSARKIDVCMQCHLETTSGELPAMIRRFDRSVNSFRPGERLSDYVVQFDDTRTGKFEVVNQGYRMCQSKCFLASAGKLSCTTCHDPHQVKHGAPAENAVNAQCRTCHTQVAIWNHPNLAESNCVRCHMPKRRTEDAVHVVLTDHKIQRRPPPGNLLAPRKEAHYAGRPSLYDPKDLPLRDHDLYMGAALVSGGADREAGIQMLERQAKSDPPAKALAVLGEGYVASNRLPEAVSVLQRAMETDPRLQRTRYNLAQALAGTGRTAEAKQQFEQAVASGIPEAEFAYANFLAKSGAAAEAEQHYRSAIRLRPLYAEAHGNLGSLLTDLGRTDEAVKELDLALRIDPAQDDAYNNLGRVLAAQGKLQEAIAHLRRAVTLNPKNSHAGYNLAQVLHQTDATAEALAQFRRVIALQPDMAEAHLGLAQALGDAGKLGQAAAEFREVLRLQPGNPEAQKGLDLARSLERGGH